MYQKGERNIASIVTANNYVTATVSQPIEVPVSGKTARLLRIPVLGSLEAVEYGSQGPVAGGFVLLHAAGLAGEFGHPGGEPGATPGGQDAPGEDAVCPFEGGVLASFLKQVFEGGMEGFGCFEGEA